MIALITSIHCLKTALIESIEMTTEGLEVPSCLRFLFVRLRPKSWEALDHGGRANCLARLPETHGILPVKAECHRRESVSKFQN